MAKLCNSQFKLCEHLGATSFTSLLSGQGNTQGLGTGGRVTAQTIIPQGTPVSLPSSPGVCEMSGTGSTAADPGLQGACQ